MKLLDSVGDFVNSANAAATRFAGQPVTPPKKQFPRAATADLANRPNYGALGRPSTEADAFVDPPAPKNPALPEDDEAERMRQAKTAAMQGENVRGTREGRDFLRASADYNRRTDGVLGASQGGTGLTPEASWNATFKNRDASGKALSSVPSPVNPAAPLAPTPGRKTIANTAAVRPDGYDQTSRSAARSIATSFASPVNPAAPKSVRIGTGQREKLTATTGVPGLNEPGDATMQLQVAEVKAPPAAHVRLENFAGGMTDPNAINRAVASQGPLSAGESSDVDARVAAAAKVTARLAAKGTKIYPAAPTNPADDPAEVAKKAPAKSYPRS
jgi:hypothetical protein